MGDLLLTARALVLRDLEATGAADALAVSALEEAVSQRQWWVDQWAAGAEFVAGLVAQDLQDALFDRRGRWPLCPVCDGDLPQHSLSIDPDIGGPDPHWVCEESSRVVAPLGGLADLSGRDGAVS
ncbi:MAG: hypothetical protein U0R80_13900 [Nocardioidaceae bacterium]